MINLRLMKMSDDWKYPSGLPQNVRSATGVNFSNPNGIYFSFIFWHNAWFKKRSASKSLAFSWCRRRVSLSFQQIARYKCETVTITVKSCLYILSQTKLSKNFSKSNITRFERISLLGFNYSILNAFIFCI